ncbi:MAG: ribonuclease PH [Candidatus Acidiferrales bacterium]
MICTPSPPRRRERRPPLSGSRQNRARQPVDTVRDHLHTNKRSLLPHGGLLRPDGRAANQLRPVKLTPDFVSTAEGSVLIEAGRTRVVATATVEDGVPQFLRNQGKGWVTSEYGMLPRATDKRTPREAARGRQSGRTQEIQRLIGRALRAVTDLGALGERTVWVDCDVIEADGGTRTASISGAFVALALAFERMKAAGILRAIPLHDSVAAISVGIVKDELLLDLAYEEDSHAQVDMNVVMTGSGKLVEVQATAEGRPFTENEMQSLLRLAAAGIHHLTEVQQELLHMEFRARAR